MVQEELKDIYEDSFIYLRYPGVPWDTLGHPGAPWGTLGYPEIFCSHEIFSCIEIFSDIKYLNHFRF